MRRKTHKLIGIIVLVGFALIVMAGIIGGAPRRAKEANARRASALFNDETLVSSSAEPIIKRPYTLYTQVYGLYSYVWGWEYNGRVYGTDLTKDEGLTDQVKKARTCVYIWADVMDGKKSNDYRWEGSLSQGAWFAPVYMTVIDREDGLRYADIKLGTVPLEYKSNYGGRYYRSLFNPDNEWSTFDLDGWLATHWEQ